MGQTVLYFVVWGLIIFAVMRFGCGAHVMGHGHHHRGSNGGRGWNPPKTDTDLVCGMAVDPKVSKSSIYDAHAYYFCSQDCRQKFEDSPARYIAHTAGSVQTMEHRHE